MFTVTITSSVSSYILLVLCWHMIPYKYKDQPINKSHNGIILLINLLKYEMAVCVRGHWATPA